jgi:hypothetical protein
LRVLVFSPEVLPYPELPTVGSGLRAWGIGQGLALCGHEVVYSMPHAALAGLRERVPPEASAVAWREGAMWAVVERVLPDVIVVCGWGVADHLTQDELAQVPLLIDQHGPHLLERDFQQTGSRDENYRAKVEAFARADYFTCAGSRQLPYFEPILADAGWDEGERRTRVAAVPFSLAPELPPREPNDGLHFVYGGVWLPWQDPTTGLQTLVEELDRRDLGTLHLFGGKHPWLNLDTGVYEPLIRRIENSPHVVLEGTLSRDELIDRYRRASVAFDLMRRNPERELAFTSRTVEYLWCGLPVVYNDYAELAELIAEYDAGWTVPADEPDTIRAVVDQIFADPELVERKGENARRLARERLTWDRTIEPLDRFVRTAGIRRNAVRPTRRLVEPPKPSLPAQVYWVWRHHGIRAVIAKSQARLRQRQPAEAEPERDR